MAQQLTIALRQSVTIKNTMDNDQLNVYFIFLPYIKLPFEKFRFACSVRIVNSKNFLHRFYNFFVLTDGMITWTYRANPVSV